MPAVSTADFEFALFDAADGGLQIGATISADDVGLVNGLFTISLDFGPAAFNGDARWIKVAVRSPAGAGGFTTLAPRQPFTAAPYALQTRGIMVDAGGQVGIGTTGPTARLHVKGDNDTSLETGTPIARFTGGDADNYLAFFGDADGNYIVADDPSTNQKDLRLQTRNHKNILLEPDRSGRVGIGTSSPRSKLDVGDGDISVGGSIFVGGSSFGSDPEYLAAAGHENLLVVRGNIDGDGTIDSGTGFNSFRISEGVYFINFIPNLSDPSLTVTAHRPQGAALRVAQVETLGGGGARITVQFTGSSDFTDSDFSFCAMGRR